MDDMFDKLMKEICQSKCEVTEKLSTSIAELKYEANSVQQDFTGPDKEDWQFKLPIQIKGDKHQQLHYQGCNVLSQGKTKPTTFEENAMLKRAKTKLEEA